jgi:hypothetical protein
MSAKRTEAKITALYERLSRDDEAAGDSNSIISQKMQLESYAAQHGFINCVHYTDDGWSGGNFERPDWKRLIADIEAGKVGCVIAKDMSRIGRDYLQPCVCVQSISRSLICKYFRAAVLPLDRELETALLYKNKSKHCCRCGALFLPRSNRGKYCPDCAAAVHRQQKATCERRRRAERGQLGA